MRPARPADAIAKAMFGRDPVDCHTLQVCVSCDGPATEFKDAEYQKEYDLSVLCQKCQDEIFS